MMNINIWLYGKPSWDMPLEGKKYINPKMMRKHGEVLKEHLQEVANILEKLQSNGWMVAEAYGNIYSLELHKNITFKKANAFKKT